MITLLNLIPTYALGYGSAGPYLDLINNGFIFRAPRAGTLRNLFAVFSGFGIPLPLPSTQIVLHVEILAGAVFPPVNVVLAASQIFDSNTPIQLLTGYPVDSGNDTYSIAQGEYAVVTYRVEVNGAILSVTLTTAVGGSYLFV